MNFELDKVLLFFVPVKVLEEACSSGGSLVLPQCFRKAENTEDKKFENISPRNFEVLCPNH